MTVQPFTQPDEAAAAIQDYLLDDPTALPEDIRNQVRQFIRPGGSISFAVAYFAELVFARKEDVPASALLLAARCALLGATNNIDNLGGFETVPADRRGYRVAQTLQRLAGEPPPAGLEWPAAVDDPPARSQFAASTSNEDLLPAPEPGGPPPPAALPAVQ